MHESCPWVQALMPVPHTPGTPVEQAPPPRFSSTVPSQSSSRPLQTSAEGCCVCAQVNCPPVQAVVPLPQTPARPVEHVAPPRLSSGTPLQSLSSPSHDSDDGAVLAAHVRTPASHARVPAAQTPGCCVVHALAGATGSVEQAFQLPPALHVCVPPLPQACAVPGTQPT